MMKISALALGLWGVTSVAHGFDIQGHRGARGLMPENTLPAFSRALALGVTTLEMDVAVTHDGIVVVHHDLRLNPATTRGPDGVWLSQPGEAIHRLTLADLKIFDVGRLNPSHRYARRFPAQVAVDETRIPTLIEVVELTRKSGNETVRFNVEIKTSPVEPADTLVPEPFVNTVLKVLRWHGVLERTIIQSFDWRALRAAQRLAPTVPTAFLSAQRNWLDNIEAGRPGVSPWTAGLDVDDFAGSLPRLVKAAGGRIWSPYHRDLDRDTLRQAHELGLSVVVWTVNKPDRMADLIDLGVDGIITDYPDRLRDVLAGKRRAPQPPTP
jgi:glycerophosphoryl diester phosphodiesterase